MEELIKRNDNCVWLREIENGPKSYDASLELPIERIWSRYEIDKYKQQPDQRKRRTSC